MQIAYRLGKTARIRLSPVQAAFFGSALLSLIAILTSTSLNRDGMLYVDAAHAFLDGGFAAARGVFAWPFLPVLMAIVARITGLDPEISGHLLNVLFMAGACAFVVASAARLFPEAGWPTCLALLAIPGINDYRDELLREYGCWFFLTLSLWLALRWNEAPRWRDAVLVQIALVAAALFRPEALAFYAALMLWQLFQSPKGETLRRTAMIGALPLVGLTVLVALYLSGQLASERLAADLGRLSPARFSAKAQAIAPALIDYARDQAGHILFFGSIALVPLKFVKKMGIFMLPLLFLFFRQQRFCAVLAQAQVFAWAIAVDLLVLFVFVTDLQFVAGRYIALLMLLSVPLTGLGLAQSITRYPRIRPFVVTACLLISVGNVIAFAPGKRHFVEAGAWLKKNDVAPTQTFIDSPRTAYYAGWQFSSPQARQLRENLPDGLARGTFAWVVLEVARGAPPIDSLLKDNGLTEVRRFEDGDRNAVVIATPMRRNQGKPASTERSVEKAASTE